MGSPGSQLIETYASRNRIEHSLDEKITFFHLDCLSSEVRLNVDFDVTLTVVGALLYHRLATRLKGFANATPQTLFAKFVNTPGRIKIVGREVVVYYEKRSHIPILKKAEFDQATAAVPWLGGQASPPGILLELGVNSVCENRQSLAVRSTTPNNTCARMMSGSTKTMQPKGDVEVRGLPK